MLRGRGPLGIDPWEWRGPPTFHGAPTPAGNLWLRPRDLAKFGFPYLNQGRWNGRQVIPAEWVEQSLRRRIGKGISTAYGERVYAEHGYGYLWHHEHYHLPEGELEVHLASGNGGQRIYVIRELRLLAVHLTGRYDRPQAHELADRLFLEHIVPAAGGLESPVNIFRSARPFVLVTVGEWPEVELRSEERALYVATYDENGDRVEVWEEDGILKMTAPPGDEDREIHLIPEGDHVFAQGLYEGGRLVRVYWPEARIVFVVSGGRVQRYEVRSLTGSVYSAADRVR